MFAIGSRCCCGGPVSSPCSRTECLVLDKGEGGLSENDTHFSGTGTDNATFSIDPDTGRLKPSYKIEFSHSGSTPGDPGATFSSFSETVLDFVVNEACISIETIKICAEFMNSGCYEARVAPVIFQNGKVFTVRPTVIVSTGSWYGKSFTITESTLSEVTGWTWAGGSPVGQPTLNTSSHPDFAGQTNPLKIGFLVECRYQKSNIPDSGTVWIDNICVTPTYSCSKGEYLVTLDNYSEPSAPASPAYSVYLHNYMHSILSSLSCVVPNSSDGSGCCNGAYFSGNEVQVIGGVTYTFSHSVHIYVVDDYISAAVSFKVLFSGLVRYAFLYFHTDLPNGEFCLGDTVSVSADLVWRYCGAFAPIGTTTGDSSLDLSASTGYRTYYVTNGFTLELERVA